MADDHADKAPDAYRTISEVAEDLNLPQHVLRFWETRFSQIKPLKRGGGRRYYRPDDVALIIGIRELLYSQGFTIKGVQKILREHGARHVQAAGRGAASPWHHPCGLIAAAVPVAERASAIPAVPGRSTGHRRACAQARRRWHRMPRWRAQAWRIIAAIWNLFYRNSPHAERVLATARNRVAV